MGPIVRGWRTTCATNARLPPNPCARARGEPHPRASYAWRIFLTSVDRIGSHTLTARPVYSYDQVKTAVGRGARTRVVRAGREVRLAT